MIIPNRMKAFDLMINTRYQLMQGKNAEVCRIAIDSRQVIAGTMFFCIAGFKVDGHDFAEDAIRNGAVVLVVEKPLTQTPEHITVFKVENTRKALAYAVSNFFGKPSQDIQLIGVTGTNGKTSTAYFMEAVLLENEKNTGLISTVETRMNGRAIHIPFATSTTPDTIELHQIFAAMKESCAEYAVMEVTSHALALHKVDGLQYETAIFTNLTQDHLDMHGTMEEYKKVKARLFGMCQNAVINLDDPVGVDMIACAKRRVITYSIDCESDYRARQIQYLENGVQFMVSIHDREEIFFVPVPGKFTVYNALGVLCAALAIHIPLEAIREGLKKTTVPGRFQSIPNQLGFQVLVDYAHSPDGLENIIRSVREITSKRVITVFGCGGDRDRTKRPMMGEIAGKLSDYCLITSDNPRTEDPNAIIEQIIPGIEKTECLYEKVTDRKEAIFKAVAAAKPGDAVIIAGKGHEDYQIFADKTIHFDDSEIAAEALKGLSNTGI